ncbi:unnamed protein product [Closterium sp. Naga37s-1]|nr:unnamed protein product [Closterium sp. Naga37s-1]
MAGAPVWPSLAPSLLQLPGGQRRGEKREGSRRQEEREERSEERRRGEVSSDGSGVVKGRLEEEGRTSSWEASKRAASTVEVPAATPQRCSDSRI